MKTISLYFALAAVALAGAGPAAADDKGNGSQGLGKDARQELVASGATQYLGMFSPAVSADFGDGWVKHTYGNGLDVLFGDGPLCIAGTEYSIFTKAKNPKNLLIFLQGGGACWQDFYNCNLFAEEQEPNPGQYFGIWDETNPGNPLADYSIVYMPYCDGSVFTGDNDVLDPIFPLGVRFHRGLQNASAGIDAAKALFPEARRILVAGSSAGGVGAASFAPFLTRISFGNQVQLSVFNDAGPIAIDLNDFRGGIPLRAADWAFGQFYPASCTDCSDLGQQNELVKWRLANDTTIRESFYSTDGDATDRFFLGIFTQEAYRDLIVTEHGEINAAFPDRYKRFIRSGDDSHTALQNPLFYLGTANGVPLNEWVEDFLRPGSRSYRERDDRGGKLGPKGNAWVDIVEDFEPIP
ncbi:MAG TPA: pectin acetylesterase-family hydrolase [Woeseiaceae bacterium]|jgi:hypothetical protein|nr:pectin acetylesterase-family hydrolase [Woeseiaceae bacterium]